MRPVEEIRTNPTALRSAPSTRKRFLKQAEFVEHVGRENILPHIQAALKRAHRIHANFSGLGDEVAHDLEGAPM
jgi:hypothetical protein